MHKIILYILAIVKSVTAKGSLDNPRGEHVVANIVKANIPVANGVIHLIDRPLVVIASPLWQYIQDEKSKARLSRFATHLERSGKYWLLMKKLVLIRVKS